MNAGPDRIFRAIRDLEQWAEWSPWAILDPEIRVEVDGKGDGFRWAGPLAGSGTLQVRSAETGRRIEFELRFEKPWRSKATSVFELNPRSDRVEVAWRMQGRLPLYLFWMRGAVRAWVGLDYRRGLAMLKDWVELGRVPSRLEFPGARPFQGWHYVGARAECVLEEFGQAMRQAMGRIERWLQEADADPNGPPFSLVH
ncbi:MAG: hypothetical protein D6766_14625, partial [Verrucomicrobia bacterium]